MGLFIRSKIKEFARMLRIGWCGKRQRMICFQLNLFLMSWRVGGSAAPFPKKMIWNPCVPTKVGFFAWEVWWG